MLMKASLADALERVLKNKPSSSAEAGVQWADAYLSYARGAQSSVASLPITAQAGMPILIGAFTTALTALAPPASALAMAAGVMAFWQSIVWVGPTAAGTTGVPGNFTLAAALMVIFADKSGASARDKASQIADAFDAGARMVMVVDIPLVQPAPPIIAPIM